MKKIIRFFIVFGFFLLGLTGAAFAGTGCHDPELSEKETSEPAAAEESKEPKESRIKFEDLEDTINMDFKPDQLDDRGF